MNIFFANPIWLLGLLALVPLAAHLFSRTRPRKRAFPSLVLLREAVRRVTRLRRPQDRWLLLLRTLAVVAIILAFLQPWLASKFSAGGNAPKTVVMVVDASASMGYVDGTRTRLTQATGAAEELLGTLPRNSRANVIWIRAQAGSALPDPGQNFDFLREDLRQATAAPEAGDIAGALAMALKQLASAEGERELCVFSDFQRSAWQDQTWAMPPNVRLTRIAIGDEQETNVALASLEVEPSTPIVGQPSQLVARVRNLSGESRRVTVYGEAGSNRLSQAVELGPWGEALAVMPMTFSTEGATLLKASLGEDRYPGDDFRHALISVRGALPVGVAGNAEHATFKTWLRALRSLDGMQARALSVGEAMSSGVKVLFVSEWDGSSVAPLRAFMRAGGALIVQPSAGLSPATLNGLFQDSPPAAAEGGQFRMEEKAVPGWTTRITGENHPIFSLFVSGTYGDPASGHFTRRISPAPPAQSFRSLLAFEDGLPALAIAEARFDEAPDWVAPIVWWNLELGATDWTSRSSFLPFFGEIVKHVASFARPRDLSEFRPGEILRFEPDPAIDPRDVELVDATDKKVAASIAPGGRSGEIATTERIKPGAYRWMAQGGVLRQAVVNFPDTESDLRRMDRAALEKSGGSVLAAGRDTSLARWREGVALWPWCVGFAALCLLMEGLIIRRIMRAPPSAAAAKAPISAEKEVVSV